MEELAQKARDLKDRFLQLRAQAAPYTELKQAADEYADTVAAWHKARFPNKKFRKPSVGYLIRAL